jgi:hypothetical protein
MLARPLLRLSLPLALQPVAGARSTLFDLGGTQAGVRYGQSVLPAGDVDRDGVPDFAVGSAAGLTGAGYAEVVSSASGTLTLPLDGYRYFNKTAELYAFGTLTPPQGLLDAGGRATVSLLPPGSASAAWLVGRTFHHAAVVLDTQSNTLETTNAWPVTIVP